MTRTWAPLIQALQEAIRDAIVAERDAQGVNLPVQLRGTDLLVGVAVEPYKVSEKPWSIMVLPPERSSFVAEVTKGLEAVLEFRLIVELRAPDETMKATLLREVQGLILDALNNDPSLAGKAGGWASPAVTLETLQAAPGVVGQEIGVRFVVRG